MYQTVVALICLNNEILFFQRDNNATIPDPGKWQLPGGHIDENEEPLAAIKIILTSTGKILLINDLPFGLATK